MKITIVFPQPVHHWPARLDIQMPFVPRVGERISWQTGSDVTEFGILEVEHKINQSGLLGSVVYVGEAPKSRVQ